MNPALGRAYRQAILSPGGTREELDMVREFLGRDPTPAAFLRDLGLEE